MSRRREYWIMRCFTCHNNYIIIKGGQIIGKKCSHQTVLRAT